MALGAYHLSSTTSDQTVMSGMVGPEIPAKSDVFRHVRPRLFTSVQGVSVVNLWSVHGRDHPIDSPRSAMPPALRCPHAPAGLVVVPTAAGRLSPLLPHLRHVDAPLRPTRYVRPGQDQPVEASGLCRPLPPHQSERRSSQGRPASCRNNHRKIGLVISRIREIAEVGLAQGLANIRRETMRLQTVPAFVEGGLLDGR
jgi:hypothetical protein